MALLQKIIVRRIMAHLPSFSPDLAASARPLKKISELSHHCILHSYADRVEWQAV